MPTKEIVIVDDNELLSSVLAEIFREYGWQVRTAVDGFSGLAAIRSHVPDVLLSDLANSQQLQDIANQGFKDDPYLLGRVVSRLRENHTFAQSIGIGGSSICSGEWRELTGDARSS